MRNITRNPRRASLISFDHAGPLSQRTSECGGAEANDQVGGSLATSSERAVRPCDWR